ncbi:hypothetical protein [Ottowia sp. VDI28]|uniref:hypothetical protein n=1 Tax=Ottowia sp. VDI28 TaxID=3133968 RepID=UPI003C301743
MIDFPSSPTVGDTHTAGGATWEWDGVAWVPIDNPAGGSGADMGLIFNPGGALL